MISKKNIPYLLLCVITIVLIILLFVLPKNKSSKTIQKSPSLSSLLPYYVGKRVLVTGGTSGIGLATAKEFAKAGATVIVCGRSREKWEKAGVNSLNITYYPCDVRIESQVEKMIKDIEPIDVAFNNAGVASGADITQQSMNSSVVNDILSYDIGLKENSNCPPGTSTSTSKVCENPIYTDGIGVFYCMKHEIASMRRNNISGSIVNTASVNSIWGSPGGAVYSMAKAMVKLLTQSTGVFEVSQPNLPPIRINCVAPGPVNTPLIVSQFPKGTNINDINKLVSAGVPMKRMAEPEEIAHAVLFLANNELASYITGSMLTIDGGLTAAPLLGS